MSNDATLEVMIQIREELAGLNRTREGIAATKKEAEGFGVLLRQGFGMGSGMELARRSVDLLRNSLSASVGEAFRMAGAIKDGSEALGITAEAYQVVQFELANAGVEMTRFVQAVNTQTESLAAARSGAGAAARAYQDLGLSAAMLEQMSPEERVFAVARAVEQAADKTRAFSAASQILGGRGLPQLVNGLKDVARNYDAVRAAALAAGRVMTDETIARLDAAQKQIDHFTKTTLPVAVGSFLGWAQSAMESAGAAAANVWNQLQGRPRGDLGPTPGSDARKPPPSVPAAAHAEDVLLARISNAEAKGGAIQSAALLDETQKRQALLPVLREQEDLYAKLINTKYGDLGKDLPANGEVTEEELARYKERNELEWKLVQIRQQRMAAVDTPLAALWRDMNDTTTLVQSTLAGGIRQSIAQLGSDIWEAAKGTQSWGDAWRNLGNMAGRILTQIITQMMVVAAINQVLGLFGYGMSGGGPAITKLPAPTPVAAAGGGTFVTRGPTTFTVGDNPGGVELVNVTPISGVGRTTINGQAVHMAGGGAAIVNGNRTSAGSESIVIHQTLNFGGGVSREEFLAALPMVAQASKAGVLDAQRRRRGGY